MTTAKSKATTAKSKATTAKSKATTAKRAPRKAVKKVVLPTGIELGAKANVEVKAKTARKKAGIKAPRKKTTPKTDGFTILQSRFIDGVMICTNGRQAAIYAGYPEESAGAMASINMQKPNILKELERRRAEVAKYVNITAHDILNELEQNRQAALGAATPQAAAAVAATMGKAKILGFLIDRVDHTSKGEKVQAGMGHFYGEGNDAIDVTPKDA